DLAAQGVLERPLEVAERLGPGLAQSAVTLLLGRDDVLAPGFDAGQLKLFGEDVGQLVERDFDFENVGAGLRPAGALAVALTIHRVADARIAGADAAVVVVAVAEVRQFDAADGDADQVLAFLAEQLAAGEEFAQVAADLALDDLAKALVVLLNGHGSLSPQGGIISN